MDDKQFDLFESSRADLVAVPSGGRPWIDGAYQPDASGRFDNVLVRERR